MHDERSNGRRRIINEDDEEMSFLQRERERERERERCNAKRFVGENVIAADVDVLREPAQRGRREARREEGRRKGSAHAHARCFLRP